MHLEEPHQLVPWQACHDGHLVDLVRQAPMEVWLHATATRWGLRRPFGHHGGSSIWASCARGAQPWGPIQAGIAHHKARVSAHSHAWAHVELRTMPKTPSNSCQMHQRSIGNRLHLTA